MAQVIPVTEARKRLLKLVDEVDEKYTRVDITKNGEIKATLISPEYLDSLEETLYTLEHSMDDIRQVEEELKRGNVVTLEELEADLQKRLTRSKTAHRKNAG